MKKVILFSFICLCIAIITKSQVNNTNPNAFITLWQVNPCYSSDGNGNVYSSAPTILFPGIGINYQIDWKEMTDANGNPSTNTGRMTGCSGSTYVILPEVGTYQLSVTTTVVYGFKGFNSNNNYNANDQSANYAPDDLLEIQQWGNIVWRFMANAFEGCSSLELTAIDIPYLGDEISLANMFNGCSSLTAAKSSVGSWDTRYITSMTGTFAGTLFNQSLNNWTTTKVTDMSNMFYGDSMFNQSLNNWGTAKVTNMNNMFNGAIAFNQSLNSWNTANVTDMSFMFNGDYAFNQPLNNWNTVRVTNMNNMFSGAKIFNQSINNWNVSNVIDMSYMFNNATAFNQSLNNWNTVSLTKMIGIFSGAASFNQSLDNWNIANVRNMNHVFFGATAFNQSLNNWNVSNVTDMSYMFNNATAFNQSLNSWNVSNVTNMSYMFNNATAFNQPLDNWNVSNVSYMNNTFNNAKAFNQSLNNWNISNVTDMSYMFNNATAFNQPLDKWNVTQGTYSPGYAPVISMAHMLDNSGVSCINYDSTLIGWANNANIASSVVFGAANITYSSAAAVKARNALTSGWGWIINGDNYNSMCSSTETPVTLLSFTAITEGGKVALQWQTATETNNKGFYVQRSFDSKIWNDLRFISSKALNSNSSTIIDYNYDDYTPANGINYYRLKQEDMDGAITYSDIISVSFQNSGDIGIYPNPASNAITITGVSGNVAFKIINLNGQIVLTTNTNFINVKNISSGVYFVQVVEKNVVVKTIKFVKE